MIRPPLFATILIALLSVAVAGRARGGEPAKDRPPHVPAYKLEEVWQHKELRHQQEAHGVFAYEKYIYVGTGGMDGQVAKVDMQTGKVAWTHKTNQTYLPAHPVSNGQVVVYAEYYGNYIDTWPVVGLDDRTGRELWKVPAKQQNMSAAGFSGDMAFIGSYDTHFRAIDWRKGTLRWDVELGGRIWSRPCTWEDMVLVGCYDGHLYAVAQATGEVAWTIDCGDEIGADPVVSGNLLFLGVYNTKELDKSRQRRQKKMLVVDLKAREIIHSFQAQNGREWDQRKEWSEKIVADGKDVYFLEEGWHGELYAFDAEAAKPLWTFKDQRVLPYPLVLKDVVLLPFNVEPWDCMRTSDPKTRPKHVVILSRRTGEVLGRSETGGVEMDWPKYVQFGDLVVTASPTLAAYRIVPAATNEPATTSGKTSQNP